jgi:hypothetical protein
MVPGPRRAQSLPSFGMGLTDVPLSSPPIESVEDSRPVKRGPRPNRAPGSSGAATIRTSSPSGGIRAAELIGARSSRLASPQLGPHVWWARARRHRHRPRPGPRAAWSSATPPGAPPGCPGAGAGVAVRATVSAGRAGRGVERERALSPRGTHERGGCGRQARGTQSRGAIGLAGGAPAGPLGEATLMVAAEAPCTTCRTPPPTATASASTSASARDGVTSGCAWSGEGVRRLVIGRTAAMCAAPRASRHRGFFQMGIERLRRIITRAHRAAGKLPRMPLVIARSPLLDIYQALLAAQPRADHRHRISTAASAGRGRAAAGRARVIRAARPVHQRDRRRRARGPRPRALDLVLSPAGFLDAGLLVPGSSDRPVVNGAPLLGIHDIVSERRAGGPSTAPRRHAGGGHPLLHARPRRFREATSAPRAGQALELPVLSADPTAIARRDCHDRCWPRWLEAESSRSHGAGLIRHGPRPVRRQVARYHDDGFSVRCPRCRRPGAWMPREAQAFEPLRTAAWPAPRQLR